MKLTITMKVDIDLDDLPEGVKFIAVDRDGAICCFLEKPYFKKDFSWLPKNDMWDDMFFAELPLVNAENALIEVEKLEGDIELGGIVTWERL